MKNIIAELTAAVDALGDKNPVVPVPCVDCGRPHEFRCDCGAPICRIHSYDTFGEWASYGLCPDCCAIAQEHFAAVNRLHVGL